MDVSDIFYFFLLGEGKGESEAPGGGEGGRYFIENPRGGSPGGWGQGGGRAGRVFAENLGGGGGANFFFRGRNAHQEYMLATCRK